MHMHIKAINTRYKGYRFRSRLEARWAVFFDELGYEWEYEPEGYVLSDGTCYLPDFRIISPKGFYFWCEVKPKIDDGRPKADSKFHRFAIEHQDRLGTGSAAQLSGIASEASRLLVGDPLDHILRTRECPCPRCGAWIDLPPIPYPEYVLIDCRCVRFTHENTRSYDEPCFMEIAGIGLSSSAINHQPGFVMFRDAFMYWTNCTYKAAKAARSARFEHGEQGAPA
jgi:hypothetical protein